MPYLNGQYYAPGQRQSLNPLARPYRSGNTPVQVGPTGAPPAPWFIWNGSSWVEDPNLKMQYEAQQQADKLLPIQADMTMNRERLDADLLKTGATLSADWASGARELNARSAEAAAERQVRNFLADKELGFRGREGGLERGLRRELSDQEAADAMQRLEKQHGYGLENMAVQQDFQGEQGQLDRLQEERLRRLGFDNAREIMGMEQRFTTGRDLMLNELTSDRRAQERGWTVEDRLQERDWTTQDRKQDRGWSEQDTRTQHLNEIDRLTKSHELYRDKDSQGALSELSMGTAQALRTQLQRDRDYMTPEGQRRVDRLAARFDQMLADPKLDLRTIPKAIQGWSGMVRNAGLDGYMRPKPTAQEMFDGRRATYKGEDYQVTPDGKFEPLGGAGRSKPGDDPNKQYQDEFNAMLNDTWKEMKDMAAIDGKTPDFNKAVQETQTRMAARQAGAVAPRVAALQSRVKMLAAAEFSQQRIDKDVVEAVNRDAQELGVDWQKMMDEERGKLRGGTTKTAPATQQPVAELPGVVRIPVTDELAKDPLFAPFRKHGLKDVPVTRYQGAGPQLPVAQSKEELDRLSKMIPSGQQFIMQASDGKQMLVFGTGGEVVPVDRGSQPQQKPGESAMDSAWRASKAAPPAPVDPRIQPGSGLMGRLQGLMNGTNPPATRQRGASGSREPEGRPPASPARPSAVQARQGSPMAAAEQPSSEKDIALVKAAIQDLVESAAYGRPSKFAGLRDAIARKAAAVGLDAGALIQEAVQVVKARKEQEDMMRA